MMKLKYLICNHKNKLTYNEMKQYSLELKNMDVSKINFIICPSLPYIYNFIDYTLGSQDISAYNQTLTGDVSGRQLKSLLIKYVIIAHSERREYLRENSEILIQKIKNANANNIKVIYCLTEDKNNLDNAKSVLEKDYERVKSYLKEDALIAYEPKWAIGNNSDLDYSYIKEIIDFIKSKTNNEIIYGGSVSSKNIDNLLKIDNISGFLISNSALNITELQNIINKIS